MGGFAPDAALLRVALSPGGDGAANSALSLMRCTSHDQPLGHEATFVPGVSLRAAPSLTLSGRLTSPVGAILEIDAQLSQGKGAGKDDGWIALHVAMPARDMRGLGVFGFVARMRSDETRALRACLRSGTADGFVDAFFEKHILIRPDETSHLDALPLTLRHDVPHDAPWREFIIFLPVATFRICLIDLRIFLV